MINNIKILIIEDNSDDLFLCKRTLAKLSLNNIDVAYNGYEALSYLFGGHPESASKIVNRPDLILLDHRMPLLDGLDFMELTHQTLLSLCIPVVVITSSPLEREKELFFEYGVIGYISKPVNIEAINRVVKSVFNTDLL